MKKLSGVILIVFFVSSTSFGQLHRATVTFTKDGKKVKLHDNFKIYIVFKDSLSTTVIKPVIKNNGFMMPAKKSILKLIE